MIVVVIKSVVLFAFFKAGCSSLERRSKIGKQTFSKHLFFFF